jgi:hypothetical protein
MFDSICMTERQAADAPLAAAETTIPFTRMQLCEIAGNSALPP